MIFSMGKICFTNVILAIVLSGISLTPEMARAGIVTFSDKLPPIGSYVSGERGGTHALFDFVAELGIGFRINITDPIHTPIAVGIERKTVCPPPPLPCVTDSRLEGYMEEEKFSSMASFNVISDNGSIDFHFGPGIVAVKTKATVFSVDNLSQTVTYINELLDFEIRGQVNGMDFVLREDPDKESTGRTTVQGLGGDTFTGPFRIDSFFDVFMELQLGNLPFKDCVPGGIGNACGRVVLVPEPTTLALCGAALGLLGLARRRKAA